MSNNLNNKLIVKSIISSSIGNVLEWYEYTLYAYFATVISALFFPSDNQLVAMMLTFATFAIGLAARPIGGIIFGYIGDTYSRSKMLTFAILLMSIPTMCIGLLPTYAQIGIAAPILLVLLRIMQGLALGGEFGASCVYLYESVPHNKRGFFGCMALTGVGTGLVLSSCTIFAIESIFTQEQIYAYAWRLPFFLSLLGSIIGFYMRKNLLETPDFKVVIQNKKTARYPLLTMFKKHSSSLVLLFSIFLTTQVSFFVVFIYGKTMMIDSLGFDPKLAGLFNLFTVLSYTISTVITGYYSDKVNRFALIAFGLFGMAVCAYPFIASLKAGNVTEIFAMSILMGALIGVTESTLNPVTAGSFPTNVRATSVAFCWNFTSVAFGGVAPLISMWLIDKTGSVDAIAYYLIGVCTISMVGAIYGIISKSKFVKDQSDLTTENA